MLSYSWASGVITKTMACLIQKLAANRQINQLHLSSQSYQLEIPQVLDGMTVGRFRGPSGTTGPTPGRTGQLGSLWLTQAWIYMTNLLPANLHIHLSLPTTVVCLLEAPAAKRQSLCLQFFPSIWLSTEKKTLKVERLGSKQPSHDDNKDGQKKKAGPNKNDNTEDLLRENNNSHSGSTCVKPSEWKMRIRRGVPQVREVCEGETTKARGSKWSDKKKMKRNGESKKKKKKLFSKSVYDLSNSSVKTVKTLAAPAFQMQDVLLLSPCLYHCKHVNISSN